MTEKRFTLHKGLDTLNIMDNTLYNEHIYINKSSRDMALVVEVLNMLHEELMQLKSEKVDLLEENITYKNAWLGLKDERDEQCEEIKEYEQLITELNDIKNKYKKENEYLKSELNDCKKDEKQLSISFMEFKMQLIEVLQQNYNYAYNQRQRNLDKSIIARTYEVLYQTIDNIAETMNVDIERFPKGDE